MLDARQQRDVAAEVRKRAADADAKPFCTLLAGPTGAGKSTLITACTGAQLPTDAARPCTKDVSAPIRLHPGPGRELWFYDLPGFLESKDADAGSLQAYAAMAEQADLILWLHPISCRSVTPQLEFLWRLRAACAVQAWGTVLNKIVFVASKADQVCPPPWICVREGTRCWFSPQKATQKLLEEKSEYLAEALLQPFAADLRSTTYVEDPWTVSDSRFTLEDREITFWGYLDEATASALKRQHPSVTAVIDRLRDNHRVVACSALFRFNLYQLLSVAVQKLGLEAIGRFKTFLGGNDLNGLPLARGLELGNLLVYDKTTNKIVFDLTKLV